LLIAGDFILVKGLQIKLQGGNRGLELMGEVVDEVLLQAIDRTRMTTQGLASINWLGSSW
jgi:hypothetical protein